MLTLLLAIVVVSSLLGLRTVWYVSDTASNGYPEGNDLNAGTSTGSPFRTVNKALSSMANSGDTVIINPGSTSDVFNENDTGNLGINLKKNLTLTSGTLQGDANFLPNRPTFRSSISGAADRVLNVPASSSAISISNLILDGENTKNLLVCGNMTTAGITVTNVKYINATSSSFNAVVFSGNSNVGTFVNNTFDSSLEHGFASAGFASLLISGGTCNAGSLTIASFPNTSNVTSMRVTGMTFDSCATAGIRFRTNGSTITTLEVDTCTFSNIPKGVYFQAANPVSVTNFDFHDNIISGTATGATVRAENVTSANFKVRNNTGTTAGGLCVLMGDGLTNTIVSGNTITVPAAGLAGISVGPVGAGAQVINNTVTCNSTSVSVLCVLLGTNGYVVDGSNSAGTTSDANLGDVSGNTYIAQKYTTSALTQAGRSGYLGGFNVNVKKVGSPAGTITCKLYSDSAGVPGTLLETSTIAITGASVTGSYQTFFFQFASHQLMTAATLYHFVLQYTGTVNGTDYFQLQRNTTITGGTYQTSTLGPGNPFVNDATHALLYNDLTGSFGSTDGIISGNTVTSTSAGAILVHGVVAGCVTGAQMYNNKSFSASIGLLFKDTQGGKIYNNVATATDGLSTNGLIYLKSALTAEVYFNSLVQHAGGGGIAFKSDSDPAVGVNTPMSTATLKNNLFQASYTSGTNYVFSLGTNGIGESGTYTFDYNCVYNGSNTQISSGLTTWVAWQGAGYDAHGINVDPQLSNSATPTTIADFTPLVSSPLIGAGTYISTITTDFNGNGREYVTTIGALLYTAPTFDAAVRSDHYWNRPYFIGVGSVTNPGKVVNSSTHAAEAWSDANISLYAVMMTEDGNSGRWKASIPPYWPADVYKLQYYVSNQTANTAVLRDTLATDPDAVKEVNWSGSAQYRPPITNSSGQVVASSVVGNVGGNVVGSVASVVGNVGGNVTGSVASVVGNVGGNLLGSVAGSVASVVGNVGGNVVGSVATVVDKAGYSLSPTGLPQKNGSVASVVNASSFAGDSGLSSTNNFYRYALVAFTSGINIGLSREVTSYVGSTKTFVFARAFPAAPSVSDTFSIMGGS